MTIRRGCLCHGRIVLLRRIVCHHGAWVSVLVSRCRPRQRLFCYSQSAGNSAAVNSATGHVDTFYFRCRHMTSCRVAGSILGAMLNNDDTIQPMVSGVRLCSDKVDSAGPFADAGRFFHKWSMLPTTFLAPSGAFP